MLVGTIPTTFLSPAAETANGAIEGHTLDGYFSVWSEDFASGTMPSGWSTEDVDGHDWTVTNSHYLFKGHHGDGYILGFIL